MVRTSIGDGAWMGQSCSGILLREEGNEKRMEKEEDGDET